MSKDLVRALSDELLEVEAHINRAQVEARKAPTSIGGGIVSELAHAKKLIHDRVRALLSPQT